MRGLAVAARAEGRSTVTDMAVLGLSAAMILAGAGLLLAAAIKFLTGLIGLQLALVSVGMALLVLAVLALALRFSAQKRPAPQPDRLPQLVFDLGYGLGRGLFARKRD